MLRQDILASIRASHPLEGAGPDYELTFCFGQEFVGFRGHFPGHPVLPAFVQILTGQCAVEARTARRWALRRVDRAKFMKIILPDQPVTVRWKEQPLDPGLRAPISLWVDGQKAAAFTLDLAVEEAGHA